MNECLSQQMLFCTSICCKAPRLKGETLENWRKWIFRNCGRLDRNEQRFTEVSSFPSEAFLIQRSPNIPMASIRSDEFQRQTVSIPVPENFANQTHFPLSLFYLSLLILSLTSSCYPNLQTLMITSRNPKSPNLFRSAITSAPDL